jgi:hypothetical protein
VLGRDVSIEESRVRDGPDENSFALVGGDVLGIDQLRL